MNSAMIVASAWFRLILPFAVIFLVIQLLTRIGLLVYSSASGDIAGLQWIEIFGWGFLFDLEALGFFLLPILVIHLIAPKQKWLGQPLRVTRLILLAALTYTWLFTAVSEYFFWEEFATRFNFIAVDYLVYTTEVLGNIKESYPLYPILAAIAVTTGVITYFSKKFVWLDAGILSAPHSRRAYGLAIACVPLIFFCGLTSDRIAVSTEQAPQELAKNGVYELFSAYRNNALDYKKFYLTHDDAAVAQDVRRLLGQDANTFVNNDPEDITRLIKHQGPEKHKNVIIVVMESMSADFMTTFGNGDNLTPNMDALSKNSLFFSDFYATGTRTVRGLEAVTLSIPPTPGQSILRRPHNEDLYSLGFVFQDRGYDTAFVYGGHGYFDNMNAFFSKNGFRIVDRTDFDDKDVTFSNVWGVCDEDLYNQVMKQGDIAYAKHQPFLYEVMTTSNHRPYTYPDGRIDIPSGTSKRSGGVKYADYAVGKFLKDAETKPWFKDTVFIFVADHTAGAGGKIELSPKKYHIPAIFYAPGFIKPQDYTRMASQIDIAPTLLGLLNFSYYSKFYGQDLLRDKNKADSARSFISNYQKMAYLKNGQLTVLEPLSKTEFYTGEAPTPKDQIDNSLLDDTVAYYQYASGWEARAKRIPSVLKQ